MKKIYQIIAVLTTILATAQPPGYYSSATGSGYTLKTQLYNIINDHNDQGYSNIDDFFTVADRDLYYENDNTILDVYSERPSSSDPYNYSPFNSNDQCGNYDSEGDCYNAEHVTPQSVFNQETPMRGDAHHLLPTDGRVNGFRSNYPFSIVGTLISQSGISNPTLNGSKLGNNLNSGVSAGYSGIVFEPINEFKGDIARIYFYFATRYQNLISQWSSYPMFDGSSNKAIADPFLNILLTWHQADPVSAKEIARNNAIYNYQGNRNPYIDNPDYACMVWGANCALGNPEFITFDDLKVYPVPSDRDITIETSSEIDNIELFNVNGQQILSIQNPQMLNSTFTISNLPKGFFVLQITSARDISSRKIIIR